MIKALLCLLLLSSCSRFVQNTDENYYDAVDTKTKSDHINLVFSHNINGETHPCGCRNFPLGGLPQLKGALFEQSENAQTIYVDSGDALFPSTKVPELLEKSQLFTAKKIAESFDINGLQFFTPGDQDFAYGIDFLGQISKQHKFKFIISNIRKNEKIKSQTYAVTKFGAQTIVFLGVVDKSLLQAEVQPYFINSSKAITQTLEEIKTKFKNLKDLKIILLSHSGMDADKLLAASFPQIDWIIGAHSQAFTQLSIDIKETKIVQVLSRNHYLGKIEIPTLKEKDDKFSIIEIRDELTKKMKDNPMVGWLDQYKTALDSIQLEEQKLLGGDTSMSPANTAASCMECHTKQGEFWQKTSHSLAFITLDHAKATNNPNCIGCHSLNYKDLKGFQNIDGMVVSEKKLNSYWDEFKTAFKDVKSVRKLSDKERLNYSKKYMALDKKHEVKHNFANVQCLNCHDKAHDHPFEMEDVPQKTTNYQDKCLKCHTSDQSPEWYSKNDKGIATSVDQAYVSGIIKKMACPKRQE
jgi:nitrate/TMAO reductase-like tetraheme cytochrome c subunit